MRDGSSPPVFDGVKKTNKKEIFTSPFAARLNRAHPSYSSVLYLAVCILASLKHFNRPSSSVYGSPLHSHACVCVCVCVCIWVTFKDVLSCEMAGGEGVGGRRRGKGNPLNASIKLLGVCQLAHTEPRSWPRLCRRLTEMRIYYKLIKLFLIASV